MRRRAMRRRAMRRRAIPIGAAKSHNRHLNEEGVPMDLGSIMTARVVTVEMDDRLEIVKEIFDTMNFHHLLVVDEHKKLSGVVSDRDLLRAISPYVGSAAASSAGATC